MTLAAGAVLGAYRLVEKLGVGGMGVVWKAIDTRLDRPVALKFLPESLVGDPAALERLISEARLLATLNHPNIVTIHSIEEAGGMRFFAMEFVQGRALSDVIPESGLPLKEFFDLAIPLCDAVSAAHERGIMHRDLKPGNVIVSPDGHVKVLDFGLARSRAPEKGIEPAEATTITLAGEPALSGTLLYMSPEQVRGQAGECLSDVFSLGALLYEMATGRPPFRGDTAADVLASILKASPVPLATLRPDLPRHLGRIIGRCLEKEPRQRIQTALDLRNELDALRKETDPNLPEVSPSIAVLPFADMSVEKDQDYFCEGIAEEIISALSRIEGLRVTSRTSSFQFKGAALDTREIGDRLTVGTLLEGSVRKAGDRLRITVQLINVADGYRLWSDRYDRELRDVFAIQEEIAQSIAQALKGTLSPKERRAIKQVATTNVVAYDYYLRGRKFFMQYNRRGIEFALRMFSRAITVDPSYALAYAGIADCSAYVYLNVDRREEHRLRAEEASLKALELDPELAEAQAAHGVALSLGERHEEAERAFETAIRLNPRLFEARYFYARDCFIQGKLEKAARLYEQASEVRPEDYQSPLLVAQVYVDLGRPEAAAESRRRGVRLAEARLDLNPDDLRALYMGANGLVALGERERGLEWGRRALEIAPDDTMLLYNMACIFSLAGEADQALDCLEKSVRRGFAFKAWVEHDNNLDAIRSHPRYHALMEGWS